MADLAKAPHGRRMLALTLGAFAFVAVLAGLARAGIVTPLGSAVAIHHGPLFVVGVFGTLIALERAVALGSRWGYAVPVGGLLFVVVLTGGSRAAGVLGVLACAGQVALNVAVLRRQPAAFTWLMVAASVSLTLGTLAWAVSRSIDSALCAWLVYFVGTIAAERLELSRLAPPSSHANSALVVLVGAAAFTSSLVVYSPELLTRVTGALLAGVGAWQLRHDIARRTVSLEGLPKFAAVGILSGASWLVFGGGCLVLVGLPAAGPSRDATIHAVLVGYVLSMVLAHAPIVLPAVARVTFRYRAALFAPLALLHVTLALRIVGDLGGVASLRTWGTLGNALALAAFVLASVWSSIVAPRTPPPAPETRGSVSRT
ncbi:MAG: hypothetical protein U0183_29575 [Polyangiaceae bacterium]